MLEAGARIVVCALLSLSIASGVVGDTGPAIGPIPEMRKYPELELWMVGERDINFHRGWWWGGRDNRMRVKWGEKTILVRDLTEQQKTYLWEIMSPEQRRQMSTEYGKIGFGMGGHLQQRPEEWGLLLNARIAEYFRGTRGWDEVARRRHEATMPPEVSKFMAEKDVFVQDNADSLTPEQLKAIDDGADRVEKLGSLIATLELKKVEIAVKGLSGGLLGIITDYLTGFVTHGAHHASDAIATVVSKMIEIGKDSYDKSPSAGEQLRVLNERIALARSELFAEIEKQRTMWRQMVGDEEPELSIVFLVDCSGSMAGSKIREAITAVKQAVAATDDGKTEWAIVRFAACNATVACRFTMDAGKVQAAADRLRAGGDTPLSYAIAVAREYLAEQGRGRAGRLIVLADGQDNCRERGAKGPDEASDAFRPVFIQQHDVTMPTPAPTTGLSGGSR